MIGTGSRIAKTQPLTSKTSQTAGPAPYTNQQLHGASPGSSGLLPPFNPQLSYFPFTYELLRALVPWLLSRCFHPSILPLASEANSDFSPPHTQTSELIPLHCARHGWTRLSCLYPLGFPVNTCREVLKLFPPPSQNSSSQKRNQVICLKIISFFPTWSIPTLFCLLLSNHPSELCALIQLW